MTSALRPIGHEDRLTLIEHLDELRTRLIICVAAFVACFALCIWQNDRVLHVMDQPLKKTAFHTGKHSHDPFEQAATFQERERRAYVQAVAFARAVAAAARTDPQLRLMAERYARSAQAAAAAAPRASPRRPVTLGVGEPFVVTIRLAAYAALLLSLPLILYQAYAFILPAFSPRERQVALPLMALVPFLFLAGVVFAYFVVLPNAVRFLQNFNDDNFDILLQARDYYRFAVLVLIAMGVLFQVPIGILAVTRVGIVSAAQLRANRRYAILVVAVLAMLMPGTDPVTMLLSMAPLVVLFEGSILMAALLDRRAARRAEQDELEAAALAAGSDHDRDTLD